MLNYGKGKSADLMGADVNGNLVFLQLHRDRNTFLGNFPSCPVMLLFNPLSGR